MRYAKAYSAALLAGSSRTRPNHPANLAIVVYTIFTCLTCGLASGKLNFKCHPCNNDNMQPPISSIAGTVENTAPMSLAASDPGEGHEMHRLQILDDLAQDYFTLSAVMNIMLWKDDKSINRSAHDWVSSATSHSHIPLNRNWLFHITPFDANIHEKSVCLYANSGNHVIELSKASGANGALGTHRTKKPVIAFGIPWVTMRGLELAEGVKIAQEMRGHCPFLLGGEELFWDMALLPYNRNQL
ncbi:hypothetical protein EDC04DRAFT_2612526 [Pisolithus marmoratus]|nr:hypothetical protein EDC04DRAFT_2612526 [Pisolithus marmoratus]